MGNDVNHRIRRERIQDWIIGALVLACVLGVAIIFVLQYPVPLRTTPIVFHESIIPEDRVFCPGDVVPLIHDVSITEPSILKLHVAIIDADTENLINSTVQETPSFPRDTPVRFTEEVEFAVPDLPPGNYKRVTAIARGGVDSIPVFLTVHFSIGEQCE